MSRESALEYSRTRHAFRTGDWPSPCDFLADDCWVFLWATAGRVGEAVGHIRAWGLQYRFLMTWAKGGRSPKPSHGPQYNAEYIVVASKGNPKFTTTKAFRLLNDWPREPDIVCAKPEGFYELLRRVTPGPRLDMFNRRFIDGFDGWGDESPYGMAAP